MTEINRTNLAFKGDGFNKPLLVNDSILELPMDSAMLDMALFEDAESPEGVVSIPDAFVKCLRDTGRVDIRRIAELSGAESAEVIEALRGSIYRNPDTWGGIADQGWETADEYLSGNLRNKLVKARMAYKLYRGLFKDNVEALEAMLPPEMRAEDIYVTLGSPWLPTDIIDDFVNYLIQPHSYHRCRGTIHDEETGSWEIPDKSLYSRYVRNTNTFGTARIGAVKILEKTLNMKTIRVTDEVPSKTSKTGTKRVINREETAAAQEKQKLIIAEFRRWIWKDEERKRRITKLFGHKYGCTVPRRFDGRFLALPNMSENISLYPYQKDAVARILLTPNTLLAHDVGAGKTYIMIAAAMELKRMGLAEKCMFVVPNNLVEQWRTIFHTLYPDSDILSIEPKDMDPDRRNQTMKKVIRNSYDGIIIAYSCFDRIPLSKQAHIETLKAERDEMLDIKRRKKKVTASFDRKLEKLNKTLGELAAEKDVTKDLICFNELGIDRLFIDEAHNYKNISIETSISGVYGINRKGSSKCDSMMKKVHYVQKTHNGGGVVMATGTPITNSISDIYVFQQYLQSGELELLDLQTFDSWVGMFAEKTTEFEIAVDTGSYRLATRFARFHNIPELTVILGSIADFHSIGAGEDIPGFDGYTDVVIPRSTVLKAYLEEISQRADRVYAHKVKPDEDNMLKITGDGRKAALDIRLVKLPDDRTQDSSIPKPGADAWRDSEVYGRPVGRCKVSECAERVAAIWHKTAEERLTQLIFCDTSTPKTGFNMYDELKRRLVDFGVDETEIAYIHDASTEARREKLFQSIREGRIRVLIGSTFKLGLGVNVQDRLVAVHHLDLPWRPADMVQREGRILRAGNLNDKVEIYRYITEGSFDAYSWQLLETKQRFISDILSGTIAGRSGSEIDDAVLDYAEVKALALGNPLLKSRVETRNEISRLSVLHRKSIENRLRLEQRYRELPDAIAAKQLELDICLSDAAFIESNGKDLYKNLDTRGKKQLAAWRKYLREELSENLYGYVMRAKDMLLLDYRGFSIVLPAGMEEKHPYLYLVREGRYRVDMSDKETGILVRIDNYLDKMDEHAEVIRRQKEILEQELRETEAELEKSESYSELIDTYTEKLSQIDEELGVNDLKNRIK